MMTRDHVLGVVLLLCCTSMVAAGPPSNHVESFTGEVLLDAKGSIVVVLVDANKGGRDGFVDQWFVLQTAGTATPVFDHATSAQIVHGEGYLQIINAERQTVHELIISDDVRSPAPPAGFTVVRAEGFGLSHNISKTSVKIPDIRRNSATAFDCVGCDEFNLCYDFCDGGGGTGAVSCTAGGTGSTSCSITSGTNACSADCRQGYYACCNSTAYAVSCRCYVN